MTRLKQNLTSSIPEKKRFFSQSSIFGSFVVLLVQYIVYFRSIAVTYIIRSEIMYTLDRI